MNEPRRPIFWFLWPRPDTRGPVDERAVQLRLVRVTSRGPLRLSLLILTSIAAVGLLVADVLAVAATGLSAGALLGAALAATMIALSLRGWVVGTYVNDAAIVVERTFRRHRVPWEEVAAITLERRPSPLLGLPLSIPTTRVTVHALQGGSLGTHAYATSPDLCCRADAMDMAHQRLLNWWKKA